MLSAFLMCHSTDRIFVVLAIGHLLCLLLFLFLSCRLYIDFLLTVMLSLLDTLNDIHLSNMYLIMQEIHIYDVQFMIGFIIMKIEGKR